MPTVGQQFRQAREAQKLSLNEIAETTKIRGDHLRALEDGNFSAFSAPVYIRGFARTYSNLLKLDTTKLLEQLGHELSDSGKVDPLLTPPYMSVLDTAMFHVSKASRTLLWPAVGLGVVVLILAGSYLGLRHLNKGDPTAGLGDGVYQVPAHSGDTLNPPVAR